jgi:hypothetical protein
MIEETQIGFLLDLWLQGMMFNPARPDGLSFVIEKPRRLSLSIRPMVPDHDQFGGRRGLRCKIHGSFSASQSQRDFVASLLERRFTAYEGMPFKLPYVKHQQEQIDAEGEMRDGFALPFEAYPTDLRELCDTATQVLHDAATRFLKLLIWALDLDAPSEFIQHYTLYWQVEPGTFHSVGPKRQESEHESPRGITWDQEDQRELQALWDTEAEEPLAHELLREATSLSHSSPRSALLVLATALEIGVKAYIAKKAPQTIGLIDKLPSPPIFRLFRDYLPMMHACIGQEVPYWSKLNRLFTGCQRLFDDRNALTHAGSISADRAKLAGYIAIASDLLYVLDVLDGHAWAKGYVRFARKELGWPGPRHARLMIRMMSHDL